MTREEFVRFLRAEERKWMPLVRASGTTSLCDVTFSVSMLY
jgi:hypothetical protein